MAEADSPTSREDGARDVAVLDHALWTKLEASSDPSEFGAAWLALLCQRVKGAARAVLILKSALHGQMEPVAYWPKGRVATAGLSSAAETALRENRGVARTPKDKSKDQRIDGQAVDIAQPIRIDDEIVGIVALEVERRPKEALAAVMREMQWGAAWVTSRYREEDNQRFRIGQTRLHLAVEIFATTLARPGYVDAARTFATELATEMDCDRVTVTRRKRRRSRVVAISHNASFDKRTKVLRAIERATDEAIDQWRTVLFPGADDGVSRRAQEAVAALNGSLASLATPLPVGDRPAGGLMLERQAAVPFTEDDAVFVETLAALAGPALDEKRRNDRPLTFKAVGALRKFLGRLFGPRYLGRKLVAAAIVGLAAYAYFAMTTFRVTADARLAGVIQRAVTAPFEGYLDVAAVRAGDVVTRGQLLARLDAHDLEIERLRRLSERERAAVEYDRALAEGDAAGLNVLRARMGQADAQIALLDAQIARTALLAPLDGVVVSGDLSQRIGDAVSRGEVLFEIAPLSEYRIEVAVDERDVDEVEVGQRGSLALSAIPDHPMSFEIVRMTPVSTQEDGLNYFAVEARLKGEADGSFLRPGMEGVAKIDIEERRIAWVWTHRIIDWLRLTWWRWS